MDITDYDPTPLISNYFEYQLWASQQPRQNLDPDGVDMERGMEESGFFTPSHPEYVEMDDSVDEDLETDARHEREWESQTYEHYSGDHT